MLTFLNESWNFFITSTGEIKVVAGEIVKDKPITYDTLIATLSENGNGKGNAKLIAHAPDMFRTLCNIAGEVKYGNASIPDFLMEDIDSILEGITSKGETEHE